jgi:branched-chain amino acid aminotransferase
VTKPEYIWLNGDLLDEATARISVFDHGLLVGDGVFETLRVYGGVPFAWRRHDERLRHSADGLGLTVPETSTLQDAAAQVLDTNALTEGRLRITITGGPSPLGSERGDGEPTVVVAARPAKAWPAAEAILTVPWSRNEHGATTGLKTISYAENVRALAYAHGHGADEALFLNTRGEVCEATGSNVFIVRDGVVCTPPETAGCLLGVTRALVLELCVREAIACEQPTLRPADLLAADEAFLTSSTREVQPISAIDGRALGSVPGPITTRLATAFRHLISTEIDP